MVTWTQNLIRTDDMSFILVGGRPNMVHNTVTTKQGKIKPWASVDKND